MNRPDSTTENESSVPFVSEESATLGEIRINHSVVANIVRIAAQHVPGVHSVGGGRFEGMADLFSRRDGEKGVRVSEDEGGVYQIEIRVILDFGVELAQTGGQIQQTVREEVSKLTSKAVGRVDLVIDGVHQPRDNEENETAWTT